MKSRRRKKPESFCTKCGAPNIRLPEFGSAICRNVVDQKGKQCGGTLRSATGIGAWRECPTCHGTGHAGRVPCTDCNGFGFHLERQWV